MKTEGEIKSEFFAVLAELQSKAVDTRELFEFLKNRLKTLFWVLEKDVHEDFAEQTDKILAFEWTDYQTWAIYDEGTV